MSTDNKSFVDKVYDAYIKSDYTYGDDNLNPKREIKKATLVNTEDELDRILENISNKVDEIGKRYTNSSFKETSNVSANMNGDGKNTSGISQNLKSAIAYAGGNTNNLVLIPSMENDSDPISIKIGLLIPSIIGGLLPSTGETGGGKQPNPKFGTDGLDVFTINCDGTVNIISSKESTDTSGEDDGESSSTSTDDSGSTSSDSDDGSSSNSSSSSSSSDSSNSTDSGSDSNAAAQEDATKNALTDMSAAIDKDNASAKQCALADLKILQMVLAILKIIKTLKTMMNPALNIAMELVQIVVLAAQCWNNPTCIGEILQRIAQKIVAIMIGIVAKLLQLIWDLLGLDCITTQAQSTIAEIKATLAGINSIFSEVNKTALQFGNGIDKVKDAFDEASAAVTDALNYKLSDRIKDQFNMEDLANNLYKTDYSKVLSNSALSAAEQTDAYDQVMDTVEGIQSLKAQAKKTINAFMKMKSKDSEVSKFASRFGNISAK